MTTAPNQPQSPTGWEYVKAVLLVGSMVTLGPLTIDTYLPALPVISRSLNTDATGVQLTLTTTLIGLALGQLVVGPWSDAVGRRLPLLTGLLLHVAASVACVFAPSVAVLAVLRLLQGLGASAASVVATAIVRDRFDGPAAAKVFSRLMLVIGVAPILAPSIGSVVLRATSWRGVFGVLALCGIGLATVALTSLSETLPPHRRVRGGARQVAATYRALLSGRTFVGLMIVAALGLAAILAYVAGSSFVYQVQYRLSTAQFGLIFAAGAGGLILTTQLNAYLLDRYPAQRMLTVGTVFGALAGLALVGSAVSGFGGVAGVMVTMWAVLAALGVILPNASALALDQHGDAAGTAAALLGATQFGASALVAPLVGALGANATAMGLCVAGPMVLGVAVLVLVVRPARLDTTVAAES
jgi:DHA1 family bicyclomycin/chloramphenicol resistance-like MFS transporter